MADLNEAYKKFNFSIDLDTDAKFKRYVPRGLQSQVMQALVETFLSFAEKKGAVATHLLLGSEVTIVQISDSSSEDSLSTK